MTDVMQKPWCCLGCSSKFTFGDLIAGPDKPGLRCPKCDGGNIHSAGDGVRDAPEYVGPIGTRN